MQGLVRKGHGQAQDAHVAFEAAAERIDKQLRRYMRRLKDKSSPSQPSATLDEIQANASYIVFDAGNEAAEAGDAPAIVAEPRVDVPTTSVSDAVMTLDLRDTHALLVDNCRTGPHNMGHRRHAGPIALGRAHV